MVPVRAPPGPAVPRFVLDSISAGGQLPPAGIALPVECGSQCGRGLCNSPANGGGPGDRV